MEKLPTYTFEEIVLLPFDSGKIIEVTKDDKTYIGVCDGTKWSISKDPLPEKLTSKTPEEFTLE